MCDAAGNCVVVCSIENLDPMGVHTGDSWTVAPQQTLPDGEYQRLRGAAFACARAVGVATGGANVQFAYEPRHGRAARDRDEPARVALVGAGVEGDRFPDRQAGRAARRRVHARRASERHHRPDDGGVRAGARLRRGQGAALRLREVPGLRAGARQRDARRRRGARARTDVPGGVPEGARRARGRTTRGAGAAAASPSRAAGSRCSRRRGRGSTCPASIRTGPRSCATSRRPSASSPPAATSRRRSGSACRTRASPRCWACERPRCAGAGRGPAGSPSTRAPRSSRRGRPTTTSRTSSPTRRRRRPAAPSSCSAAARTGSARGSSSTTAVRTPRRRCGALGYEAVLVNSNPETVSTDYDTSDRLYLEPLTLERVLDVCELEEPLGVVVSLGGQTPLRLAPGLAEAGVPLLGDPLEAIHRAEDRGAFAALLAQHGDRGAGVGGCFGTRGGARRCGADRLSGAGAPAPRARRPGYARRARAGRAAARRAVPRRPLPRGRDRARRRRTLRRRRCLGRGDPGAHRAGRACTRATRPASCRRRR